MIQEFLPHWIYDSQTFILQVNTALSNIHTIVSNVVRECPAPSMLKTSFVEFEKGVGAFYLPQKNKCSKPRTYN